jgi:dTDP-4-amino-4,6-dideoxygalactose transaminase
MQIIQAPRASAILYHLLVARGKPLPWLLPANICPIVPITFFKARIPFEFVDISAETLHMDLEQVEDSIKTRKYGGLLYAHTYGDSSTPKEFFASAKVMDSELLIIDDRCLCVPDLEPDAGSLADVMLYSTGYAKTVELNFGGYAFIKEDVQYQPEPLPFTPQDYEELESSYKEAVSNRTKFIYRDTGWLETNADVPTWYDYLHQVESRLNNSIARRKMLNDIYLNRLPAEIQLPQAYQTWRFNIRVKNKSRMMDAIFNARLFASSHYASLAGIMSEGEAPQAEKLANEVINLFNDHHFNVEQAEQVSAIIMENLSWN